MTSGVPGAPADPAQHCRRADPPSDRAARLRPLASSAAAVLLGGCAGVQSTFSTFGEEAEAIRTLAWVMIAGAALITIGVGWIALHAVRAPPGALDYRGGMRVILWLGALGPTALLGVLLVFALPNMMPLAGPEELAIEVEGEQFWWRVRYRPPGAAPVETANEVRLPVGRTVAFALTSPDVIHSFWIPGLAGKLDMIPGRINKLVVRATKPGVYRGVCAEFCGLSHALMAFDVIAMEPAAFDAWLAAAARPVADADTAGRRVFESHGCDGCHTLRGHSAESAIGPDLTRLGLRRTLGAGTVPMSREAIVRFTREPAAMKPGVLMPGFATMAPEEATAIADYLMEHR
jgi:cytochrome c oxidase subunit 2